MLHFTKIKVSCYSNSMTIKTRNRLLIAFLILSSLTLITNALIAIWAAFSGGITPPEGGIRTISISLPAFKYSFHAVVASVFVLSLAAPVLSFIIFKRFEKTPSLEVFFFCGFLIGCLSECMRLIIPLFDLWKTYSIFLVAVGRIVICGRILAPLSLFFAAAFSGTDYRQDAERNFMILIIVAIVMGLLFPLDTGHTTSTCTVLWSFRTPFMLMKLGLMAATFSLLAVESHVKNSSDHLKAAIGITILEAGYFMLCSADCYILAAAGTVLLGYGAYRYLTSIHNMYMWS